jgi:peptidoglycan/LPS O-acetylase OafA/YrhL
MTGSDPASSTRSDASSSTSSKNPYRPEIDGLRALAVLAVIFNHLNKDFIPTGYLGVDIFFVISGYVITSSLLAKPSVNFRSFLLDFYARRIRRLLPALAVFVLVTALLTCLFNPLPGVSLETGLAALFGASNLWLIKDSTDYFSVSTELNTFTHTWSLGVEEQFYLLFPILVWLTGVGRGRLAGIRWLTWIMSGLGLASLIAFVVLSRSNPVVSYFSMPTRFWQMGAGCLVCLSRVNPTLQTRFYGRIPPLLPLLVTVGLLFIGLKVKSAVAIVLVVALLLACLRPHTLAYRLLTIPGIRSIGLMSYSIYLWHWTVLAISRWTVGINRWTIPWQLALILALGALSYHYIENPIRYADWARSRRQSFRLGGGILGFGSLFMGSLIGFAGHRFFLGDLKREQYEANVPLDSAAGASQPNCMWWMGKGPDPSQALTDCVVSGPTPIKQHIYLLGDSHTENYQAWVDTISARPGLSLTHAFAGGQLVPVVPNPPEPGNIRFKDGERQTNFVNLVLQQLQPNDVLIVSSYLLQQFRTDSLRSSPSSHPGRSRWQAWQDELESLIQKVEAKGAFFVFVQPPPDFRLVNGWQNITNENCTLQWYRPSLNGACLSSRPRQEILNEIGPIARGLQVLERRHKHFYIYNPFSQLCPPNLETCSNYLDGHRTYSDYSHMTRAGSDVLVKDFDAFLNRNQIIPSPQRQLQPLKAPQ